MVDTPSDANQPDEPRRVDADDIQHAAGRLLERGAGDVETARSMGSGDEAGSQSIPAGDLDRDAVANARRTAQDSVPHDASEVGAPWQGVPEGARQRSRSRSRTEPGGRA
jgi:hypothetical protein